MTREEIRVGARGFKRNYPPGEFFLIYSVSAAGDEVEIRWFVNGAWSKYLDSVLRQALESSSVLSLEEPCL